MRCTKEDGGTTESLSKSTRLSMRDCGSLRQRFIRFVFKSFVTGLVQLIYNVCGGGVWGVEGGGTYVVDVTAE